MTQYELKITGKVQGVGFRYYTQKIAGNLGLKGWVRNTIDRGVLVMVQGEEKEIEIFIDYLKIGPARARVDNISKYKMQILSQFKRFEIKN